MSADEKETGFVVTASVEEDVRCLRDKSLAGAEGQLRFNEPTREYLRIVPTDSGFDVQIPEGVTLTEAASRFIEAVRKQLNDFEK